MSVAQLLAFVYSKGFCIEYKEVYRQIRSFVQRTTNWGLISLKFWTASFNRKVVIKATYFSFISKKKKTNKKLLVNNKTAISNMSSVKNLLFRIDGLVSWYVHNDET